MTQRNRTPPRSSAMDAVTGSGARAGSPPNRNPISTTDATARAGVLVGKVFADFVGEIPLPAVDVKKIPRHFKARDRVTALDPQVAAAFRVAQ